MCKFNNVCMILILLFIGGILNQSSTINHAYAGSLIPDELIIKDEFTPGLGVSVGKVLLVQGEVFLIHENRNIGYRAKDELPLFEGDMIITRPRGRIRFQLNDESIMTLASGTRLVINKSIYDPEKKDRSSFMGMALGKARFWVKKLLDFKRSEFKVKTKTAVVGVRGSDFIVIADSDHTEVTALEKTDLEVVSLVGPEDPRRIIDFERIVIHAGTLPSEAEEMFAEDIEDMKQDFDIMPDAIEPEAVLKTPPVKPEGPPQRDHHFEAPEEKHIFVSDDELVPPGGLRGPEGQEHGMPPMSERPAIGREDMPQQAERVMEKHEEISEKQQEVVTENIRKELPPFPKPPE